MKKWMVVVVLCSSVLVLSASQEEKGLLERITSFFFGDQKDSEEAKDSLEKDYVVVNGSGISSLRGKISQVVLIIDELLENKKISLDLYESIYKKILGINQLINNNNLPVETGCKELFVNEQSLVDNLLFYLQRFQDGELTEKELAGVLTDLVTL